MKQTRRKELKTNELSIFLQQTWDSIARNSNYVLGGIVVVALVLAIGLFMKHSAAQTEARQWQEYRDIQQAVAEGKDDALDRAEALANQTAGNAKIGPQALSLYADMLHDKAMAISPIPHSPERDTLLEKAENRYQQLIRTYAGRPDVVSAARMRLAAVTETLYVAGKSDRLEIAKQQYKEIQKDEKNAFATLAKQKLDTLVARTAKIETVETRPAEPTPEAAATKPTATKTETAPTPTN